MPSTNSSPISQSAVHQAITFVSDEAKNVPFAAQLDKMQALSTGLHLCLELIETSNTARDCGCDDLTPTLGAYDTGRMMRLVVATAGVLADMVEEQLSAINHEANAAARGSQHGS